MATGIEKVLGPLSNGMKPLTGTDKTGGQNNGETFMNMVKDAVQNVVDTQNNANQLSVAAAQGEDVPMHKVIQAVSEAEMTLQTMTAVRDKAVEAYQEILRMPI